MQAELAGKRDEFRKRMEQCAERQVSLQKEQQKVSTGINTLQEEKFHRNSNFTISLIANSLNLSSAHYYIIRNLSMIVYMIEIQKSKLANI